MNKEGVFIVEWIYVNENNYVAQIQNKTMKEKLFMREFIQRRHVDKVFNKVVMKVSFNSKGDKLKGVIFGFT